MIYYFWLSTRNINLFLPQPSGVNEFLTGSGCKFFRVQQVPLFTMVNITNSKPINNLAGLNLGRQFSRRSDSLISQ